ncbi:hypothetical protein NXW71_17975 [Parabacteroides merdae]|nr:hypothetical protein [Parabacteroides merdae]
MDAKKIEEVPFEEVYEVEKYGTYYSENKFGKKYNGLQRKSVRR